MSRRSAISVSDLLGIRHQTGAVEARRGALDCAGVVGEVLRRGFGADAREAFIEATRGGDLGAFAEVPTATRLGDVVVSTNEDGTTHVSALVSLSPPMVASSAFNRGMYVARLSAVHRIDRVLRYSG